MVFRKRKSPRLPHFDYSAGGAYFVTICTREMHCILAQISVGEGLAPPVHALLPLGQIADDQVKALAQRFPTVSVEKYVIMPNHIHMILSLTSTGGASPSPTVSTIIGTFKSLTTRACKIGEPLFQRSFHDHIIRTEDDYRMIWHYIDNNPAKWAEDRFYCE